VCGSYTNLKMCSFRDKMPRHYIRKNPNCTDRTEFSDEAIKLAIQRVLDGEAALKVSKATGIPRTTIRRKVALIKNDPDLSISACISPNFKKSQVFTDEQETKISEYLENCSEMFYGLTTNQTRELAYQTAVFNKLRYPKSWDRDKKAGIDWFLGFMNRRPNLSLRRPEALSIARASAFNKTNMDNFFDKLETVLMSFQFEGKQIYNLDESGFTTVQSKMPKVVGSRGKKRVGQMSSRERGELVTVCCIVSAVGEAVPPFFVFPRKRFNVDMMMRNAPEGSAGTATSNGWMNSEKFIEVMRHFKLHVRPTADYPVLLLMDNHESHLSLEVP